MGGMKNKLDLLIEEQEKEHDRLLDLSAQLAVLLKQEKSGEKLKILMNERQEIIAGIDRNWEKLKNADGKPVPGNTKKIEKTIEEILKLDKASSEIMQKQGSAMTENMKSISKGGRAIKNYGRGKSGGAGRFISIKE